MNICLVTSSFLPSIGGRELVVHNLANALCHAGHRVVVFKPHYRNDEYDHPRVYELVKFGFRGHGRLGMTTACAVYGLRKVVKEYKIDVVNVHEVCVAGNWAYRFSLLDGKTPIVGTPHGSDLNRCSEANYGVRRERSGERMVRRNLKSFDFVTAVSKSMAEEIFRIRNESETLRIVPNGIRTSDFDIRIDRDKVRQEYKIPSDTLLLISVGRNHPIKRFEFAVEAAARLRSEGFNLSYLLIGCNMGSIREKARGMGFQDHLFTPGELAGSEVARLLRASDVFVNSSYVESFGLAALEAMACGLPIVATDVPGNRDLIGKDFGDLVAPNDHGEQLARAIQLLAEDAALRRLKGERAKAASMKYSWDSVANMYVDAYCEAVGAAHRTRSTFRSRIAEV